MINELSTFSKTEKEIISLKVFKGFTQNNKKQISQYLHFRCAVIHLNCSFKKLGRHLSHNYGYILDVLASLKIQEIVKRGSKVKEIYEGVIYRNKFEISPFGQVFDKLFDLRHKYKGDGHDVMHLFVKWFINSFFRGKIRKNLEESFECKPEAWVMSEYDERVKGFRKISQGNYFAKMVAGKRLADEVKKINYHGTTPRRFCIKE